MPSPAPCSSSCSWRGWAALDRAGVAEQLRGLSQPIRGRVDLGMMLFSPYSDRGDAIEAVGRDALQTTLEEAAHAMSHVRLHHGQEVQAVDVEARTVTAQGPGGASTWSYDLLVGADGVASAVAKALVPLGTTLRRLALDFAYADTGDEMGGGGTRRTTCLGQSYFSSACACHSCVGMGAQSRSCSVRNGRVCGAGKSGSAWAHRRRCAGASPSAPHHRRRFEAAAAERRTRQGRPFAPNTRLLRRSQMYHSLRRRWRRWKRRQ